VPVLSDGSKAVTVDAPVEEIPVFVASGDVVVLLPGSVQTLTKNHGKAVVGLAAAGDDREIWLFRGGERTFVEADGALRYAWSSEAKSVSMSVPNEASWSGAKVAAKGGALSVSGNGKLVIEGIGTLLVEGGASDRKLVIRVR
jgi:alpha-glucosidase (family GH31 glycosyl hydrolase)